jgi:hypothetical protein
MRNLLPVSVLILATIFISIDTQAMKWQGRRQSENVIDIRKETKAVNTQIELEAGRRYLVAMILMAEKDANEHPECATLTQEIEKLKTVKAEMEAMGSEPVRRLICADENAGSRVNLCAKILAKDPASVPAMPDLKEFESELTDAYGPVIEQVGRMQAAFTARSAVMAKEDLKCRATLQLIQRKAAEVSESYGNLHQMVQELIKSYQ